MTLKLKRAHIESAPDKVGDRVVFYGMLRGEYWHLSYTVSTDEALSAMKDLYGKEFNIWLDDKKDKYRFTSITNYEEE